MDEEMIVAADHQQEDDVQMVEPQEGGGDDAAGDAGEHECDPAKFCVTGCSGWEVALTVHIQCRRCKPSTRYAHGLGMSVGRAGGISAHVASCPFIAVAAVRHRCVRTIAVTMSLLGLPCAMLVPSALSRSLPLPSPA